MVQNVNALLRKIWYSAQLGVCANRKPTYFGAEEVRSVPQNSPRAIVSSIHERERNLLTVGWYNQDMANRRKIRREIREAKERLGSWQSVNNELFDGKMNTVTLRLIGTTDYFPVEKEILRILCPPKQKPDMRYRNLGATCTQNELRRIQSRFSTRERVEKLLGENYVATIENFSKNQKR